MSADRPKMGPRALTLAGTVAAALFTIFGNLLAARHYTRWDWTSDRRFTLSAPTVSTLEALTEPVHVWVLMGTSDPLAVSLKQLFVAYRARTQLLDIHFVDPDRDALQFEDVRTRYGVRAGRTEDGRVATDAVVVVARGERHWYVRVEDLIGVSESDGRANPREEQAITGAIRNVLSGEKTRLCFTQGHGELAIGDPSEKGLSFFKEILQKNNYETSSVDTTDPREIAPFKGCDTVIVASPRGAFAKEEANRLKTYLVLGGSLFAAVAPIAADTPSGMEPAGLDEALAPFGIGMDEDLVVETDPARVLERTRGIRFYVGVKPHAVTGGLVGDDPQVPRTALFFARSLRHVAREGSTPASDLIVTGPRAFGVVNVSGAADWEDAPPKAEKDLGGPLVLAMAGERPKLGPSAPHGPRAVVVGAGSILLEANWRDPAQVRGAALFVESAISWLAAKPVIVDVPARASVPAGLRLTEESRSEVKRYVLVFMPGAALLLGIAVALRRRSTDKSARIKKERAGARET